MASNDPLGDYIRVGRIAAKIQPQDIDPYTPLPTQRDRQFGEIIRYFARFTTHTSPADILEVSKTTYANLKKNPLYRTTKIRWRISGKLDDQYDLTNNNKPVRLYTGVTTANKLSVELADEDIPGIKEYITNYIRFWKF